MNRSQLAADRRERAREREADAIATRLEHLDRERKQLRATFDRLNRPLDVPALIALAKKGTTLTQAELGCIAAEDSDAYNAIFEAAR
jgi:hypothetical protein